MKVWVARDKDGSLCLFDTKPSLAKTFYSNSELWCSTHMIRFNSDDPIGEGITFENSPQLITLGKQPGKGLGNLFFNHDCSQTAINI